MEQSRERRGIHEVPLGWLLFYMESAVYASHVRVSMPLGLVGTRIANYHRLRIPPQLLARIRRDLARRAQL